MVSSREDRIMSPRVGGVDMAELSGPRGSKLGVRILSPVRNHLSVLNRRVTRLDLLLYEDPFAATWEKKSIHHCIP